MRVPWTVRRSNQSFLKGISLTIHWKGVFPDDARGCQCPFVLCLHPQGCLRRGVRVKTMVFPVVMYGCESWTVKKAECHRIDAFELWCWRRLLRVPWTARRSNQSILKEISPGCSLEGLIPSSSSVWNPRVFADDARGWQDRVRHD